uniref:NR LBD domain-containing protein n=1 Tax=Callorhinchus milii TaxID=7868 RepID=A0A4W3H0N6_CALMI
FAHFTELAIISVQEIVDFAKQVPGFLDLSREDQIALLKASTIEVSSTGVNSGCNRSQAGLVFALVSVCARVVCVCLYFPFFCDLFAGFSLSLSLSLSELQIMLLETARRYNHDTECITFLKDFSYSKDDFARAGLQFEFINPIFEFSKGMKKLQLDDAEYALLIAINIFSADRPNVQDHELVERLQLPYVEALHSYLRINRPKVRLAAGQRPARFLPQPPSGAWRGLG